MHSRLKLWTLHQLKLTLGIQGLHLDYTIQVFTIIIIYEPTLYVCGSGMYLYVVVLNTMYISLGS